MSPVAGNNVAYILERVVYEVLILEGPDDSNEIVEVIQIVGVYSDLKTPKAIGEQLFGVSEWNSYNSSSKPEENPDTWTGASPGKKTMKIEAWQIE